VKKPTPVETLDEIDGTVDRVASRLCALVKNIEIRELVASRQIRVKSVSCTDCGEPCALEKIARMLDLWVHHTRCMICREPLRIDIRPYHGTANLKEVGCWHLKEEYKGAGEVSKNQGVSVVHDKCWNQLGRKK